MLNSAPNSSNTTADFEKNQDDLQSGQVFFEFILLMLVLTILSYTMLYGVNRGVSLRWQEMVHLVTKVEGSAPPEFQ